MHLFASPASQRRTLRHLVLLGIVVVGSTLVVGRFVPWLADPIAIRQFVSSYGAFAPVVFVALTAMQVVVAPIPGQAMGFVGGFLFGPLYGSLYSLLGVTIGSTVVFLLSKRYGRPYVERMLSPEAVERFDEFVDGAGPLGLLVIFLVPGLPDDAVCFLAGVSEIPLRRLVVLVVVGRTPAFVVVSLAGANAASGNHVLTGSLIASLVAASALGYRNRERIVAFLRARQENRTH